MNASTYPLAWPPGWQRLSGRERKAAAFNVGGNSTQRRLEISDAVKRLYTELAAFDVKDETVVISTNLRPRLGGEPVQPKDLDPGVAVYWERKGARQCMAIDRYDRVADNLAAVAATLNAMRAIDRHGGATILDRAFTGFTALPSPEQAYQVLGVGANATKAEIDRAYKRLAAEHHPDRGGDLQQMARINVARDQLMRSIT